MTYKPTRIQQGQRFIEQPVLVAPEAGKRLGFTKMEEIIHECWNAWQQDLTPGECFARGSGFAWMALVRSARATSGSGQFVAFARG